VAESLRTGEPVERAAPTHEELRATLDEHFRLQRVYRERQRTLYPGFQDGITLEEGLVLDFRTRFFRYIKGIPGSNRFRAGLASYKTLDEIRQALDALFAGEAGAGKGFPPPAVIGGCFPP
jgi:tRNA-dihydrouridine synthase